MKYLIALLILLPGTARAELPRTDTIRRTLLVGPSGRPVVGYVVRKALPSGWFIVDYLDMDKNRIKIYPVSFKN